MLRSGNCCVEARLYIYVLCTSYDMCAWSSNVNSYIITVAFTVVDYSSKCDKRSKPAAKWLVPQSMVPHSKGYGMVTISLLGFERGRQSYVLLRENQKQPVPFFDLINTRLALSYTIFFSFFFCRRGGARYWRRVDSRSWWRPSGSSGWRY